MKWPIKLAGREFNRFLPRDILKIPVVTSEDDELNHDFEDVEMFSMEHFTLRGMVNVNRTEPWNGLIYEPCNANRPGFAFMVIDRDKEMAIVYYL